LFLAAIRKVADNVVTAQETGRNILARSKNSVAVLLLLVVALYTAARKTGMVLGGPTDTLVKDLDRAGYTHSIGIEFFDNCSVIFQLQMNRYLGLLFGIIPVPVRIRASSHSRQVLLREDL
jgi:hypothetical protein